MFMSSQVAVTLEDLLDKCATIKAGHQVLILAATDGLHGGPNLGGGAGGGLLLN